MTETNNACTICGKQASPLIVAADDYYCPGCAAEKVPSACDMLRQTADMAGRNPALAETWIQRTSQPAADAKSKCLSCKLNPPVQIRRGNRTLCTICALEEWPDLMTGLIDKLGRS